MLSSILKAIFIAVFLIGSIIHVAAAEDQINGSFWTGIIGNEEGLTPADLRRALISQGSPHEDFGLLQLVNSKKDRQAEAENKEGEESKEKIFRIDLLREFVAELTKIEKEKTQNHSCFFSFFPAIPCDRTSKHYARNSIAISLDFLIKALPLFSSNENSDPMIREKIFNGIEYFLIHLCFEQDERAVAPGSPKEMEFEGKAEEVALAGAEDFLQLLAGNIFDPSAAENAQEASEKLTYDIVINAIELIARNYYYGTREEVHPVGAWRNHLINKLNQHKKKHQFENLDFITSKADSFVRLLQKNLPTNPLEDFFILFGIQAKERPNTRANDIRNMVIRNNHHREGLGLVQRVIFEREEIFMIDALYRWGKKVEQKYPDFTNFVRDIPCGPSDEHYVRHSFVSALDFLLYSLPWFSTDDNYNNNLMREKIIGGMNYYVINLCFKKKNDEGKLDGSAIEEGEKKESEGPNDSIGLESKADLGAASSSDKLLDGQSSGNPAPTPVEPGGAVTTNKSPLNPGYWIPLENLRNHTWNLASGLASLLTSPEKAAAEPVTAAVAALKPATLEPTAEAAALEPAVEAVEPKEPISVAEAASSEPVAAEAATASPVSVEKSPADSIAEASNSNANDEAADPDFFRLIEESDPDLNNTQQVNPRREMFIDVVVRALFIIVDDVCKNTKADFTLKYWQKYLVKQCSAHNRAPQDSVLMSMTLRAFSYAKIFEEGKKNFEIEQAIKKSKLSPGNFKNLMNKISKELEEYVLGHGQVNIHALTPPPQISGYCTIT